MLSQPMVQVEDNGKRVVIRGMRDYAEFEATIDAGRVHFKEVGRPQSIASLSIDGCRALIQVLTEWSLAADKAERG